MTRMRRSCRVGLGIEAADSGQALVEWLAALPVVCLLFMAAVEISSLCLFRILAVVGVGEVASELSFHELDLLRSQSLKKELGVTADISDDLRQKLEKRILSLLKSHPLEKRSGEAEGAGQSSTHIAALDLGVNIAREGAIAGVVVELRLCVVPIFFSFALTRRENREKDCLGRFIGGDRPNNAVPGFQLRFREVAFMPWQAAAQIYRHGEGEPKRWLGLLTDLSQDDVASPEESGSYFGWLRGEIKE